MNTDMIIFSQKTLTFAKSCARSYKVAPKSSFISAAASLTRSSRHKSLFLPIDTSATAAVRNQRVKIMKGGAAAKAVNHNIIPMMKRRKERTQERERSKH